jgi:hypothetical protein
MPDTDNWKSIGELARRAAERQAQQQKEHEHG